ncbi:MAG: hypothetical protein Kapaf2KO_03930 [Candidatus Kapaibacteriales bacterium]
MRKLISTAIIAFLFSASTLLAQFGQEQTAESLVNANRAAIGQIDQSKFDNVIMKTSIVSPLDSNVKSTNLFRVKNGNKFRMDVFAASTENFVILNDTSGLAHGLSLGIPDTLKLNKAMVEQNKQNILQQLSMFAGPFANTSPENITLEGSEKKNGIDYYKLKLTDPISGMISDIYINKSTNMLAYLESDTQQGNLELTFDKYEKHSGIIIPTKITTSVNGNVYNVMSVDEFKLGADLNDSLFKVN